VGVARILPGVPPRIRFLAAVPLPLSGTSQRDDCYQPRRLSRSVALHVALTKPPIVPPPSSYIDSLVRRGANSRLVCFTFGSLVVLAYTTPEDAAFDFPLLSSLRFGFINLISGEMKSKL
jgi:hypothetical protein